jgi:NADH dehydrogenase [ubiquinone] 1 alpha subcomplex assembly factor 6
VTADDLAGSRHYCADQVRCFDRDRFLTGLAAPPARRGDLFALYAFNLEIAKTAEVVSEAMIGRIRLQWWRDAIGEAYDGRPKDHAILTALAAAIRERDLTQAYFERLIDAREKDLEDWQPASLGEMEAYAQETSVPLLLLALEILGHDSAPARAIAEPLGVAWALTGLLRAVPFLARRKRQILPRDMMAAGGVLVRDLMELRSSAALNAVVEAVAARARERLTEARQVRPRPPRSAHSALLISSLAQGHLASLRRAGYDPFDERVQRSDPGAAWRLTWARMRGVF